MPRTEAGHSSWPGQIVDIELNLGHPARRRLVVGCGRSDDPATVGLGGCGARRGKTGLGQNGSAEKLAPSACTSALVTSHGFAYNVRRLRYFDLIVRAVVDRKATSLEKLPGGA